MRILMGISGFPYAAPMVEYAGKLAAAMQAEIHLLTAQPEAEPRETGERILAQASALLPSAAVAEVLRRGPAARAILAEARRIGADLVVIGAHDRPSLGELLLGSVARQVVTRARASVLVVRQAPERVQRLLVCSSGKRVSEMSVAAGGRIARAMDARVRLVHVVSAASGRVARGERMDEGLHDLLEADSSLAATLQRHRAQLASLGVETRLELRQGIPAQAILTAIEVEDVDLVVLGRHGNWFHRLFLGAVPMEVVHHAPRPVLVVRGPLAKSM